MGSHFARLIGWAILLLAVSCSRRSGLEVAGNPVNPGPTDSFSSPKDFALGDPTGLNVPVTDRNQPVASQPITDPFQNAFLSGQDPWSLLDSFLPPYRPSANSSESRTVLTAGRYKISPSANGVGGFYRLDIALPITSFVNGAECPSPLAGPIYPGVAICLDMVASPTPMPVPIRMTIQSQTGSKSHTVWVLILPGKAQELKITTAIPPIIVNEEFGSGSNRKVYQVQPSVFPVVLNSLGSIDEYDVTSSDPVTQISRQGNQIMVSTSKRGEQTLIAKRRSSSTQVSIKIFVPLQYSMKATSQYGTSFQSYRRLRIACNYNGAPSQMEVRDPNGFAYLIPLQNGSVMTAPMQRDSNDKMAKAFLKVPGEAGSLGCRAQVLDDDDNRIEREFALDVR